MSRVKILNILLLIIFLSSCGILNPYIDRRRNPGTSDITKLYSGRSKPNTPAVCYNSLLSTEQELQALADAECIKNKTGSHAEHVKTDRFVCKLFLPSINYYKCIK